MWYNRLAREEGDPMNEYAKPIDITTSAELQHLAEHVQKTRQSVPLTQGDKVIAVVQPAPEVDTSPAAGTVQSPHDFYAEAVARPDVAEILRRLAK
jgi:hypothetical protein